MTAWRDEPASSAQLERLNHEGIKFGENITKGEASDLISQTEPADERDIEKLKFFKVPKASSISDFEARSKLLELFSVPENQTKWDNRPASKDQKKIYKYFNLPVSKGLTHKTAESAICEFFESNPGKGEEWANLEELQEERADLIEELWEEAGNEAEYYDSKKIPKAIIKQIVAEIEGRKGATVAQISEAMYSSYSQNLMNDVFAIAHRLKPELKKQPQAQTTRVKAAASKQNPKGGASTSIWWVVAFVAVFVFAWNMK